MFESLQLLTAALLPGFIYVNTSIYHSQKIPFYTTNMLYAAILSYGLVFIIAANLLTPLLEHYTKPNLPDDALDFINNLPGTNADFLRSLFVILLASLLSWVIAALLWVTVWTRIGKYRIRFVRKYGSALNRLKLELFLENLAFIKQPNKADDQEKSPIIKLKFFLQKLPLIKQLIKTNTAEEEKKTDTAKDQKKSLILIEVRLKNNKCYIGLPEALPKPTKPGEAEYFSVIPIYSGYRQEDDHALVLTTNYFEHYYNELTFHTPTYDKDGKENPARYQELMGNYLVHLNAREIVSVRKFNPKVFFDSFSTSTTDETAEPAS